MENRNGLLVRTMVTQADGTAERDAALLMAWKTASKLPASRRITLGGDKNYDTRDFVSTVREAAPARLMHAPPGMPAMPSASGNANAWNRPSAG
jgi:hypothetical protein